MEYNRYGRAGEAPTRGSGGSSGQSLEHPLREARVLPHPQLLPSTRAAVPLPYGSFTRDNFGRLGIDMLGTHLVDGGATLSPYGFREPIGISVREPEPYRESIGMPLWNGMGVIEQRYRSHDLVRRESTGLGREPFVRGGQHLPLLQRQIIARELQETPSSTARKKRPVRRITPSSQRDPRLTPPMDSDSNSLPADSEPKQNLQLQPEKEVSHQELNKTNQESQLMFTDKSEIKVEAKENYTDSNNNMVFQVSHQELNKTNQESQLMFTNKSEIKVEAKENYTDSNNVERPGWCSLCDIDGVTKEVLHKSHAFGKKHQSMIKKLEEASKDRQKWLESVGWCSLCEVHCETMEALHTEHKLTEKHQMMLGKQPKPQKKQDDQVQNIDCRIGKRKQQEEEGSMSSPKRQKLLVSSKDCKICNKVFSSQIELESHLGGKKHASQLKKLENSAELLDVNSGQSKKPEGPEGSMSSPKCQKLLVSSTDCKICNKVFSSQVVLESHLAGKKHASQLKKLGNSAKLLAVNSGQSKKSEGVDVQVSENSKLVISAKNGQEEKESMSSPKPGMLLVSSIYCKICNKMFSSQAVLESHLAGKKHASQLRKIENSADNGQNKKPVGLDVQVSKNSKLVISVKNVAKPSGKDEEITLEAKDGPEIVMKTENDDKKEISEPIEDDQESMVRSQKHARRESSKPNEVDCKKEDTLGSGTEDVTTSVNIEV